MKITGICITSGNDLIIEASEGLSQKHLVYVAPAPVLPGLEGLHDGMFGPMKVLGGVFVLGRVTAADLAADETFSEMDPCVAHLEALLAALAAGLDRANFFYVGTG
jgi:hypothetical protein